MWKSRSISVSILYRKSVGKPISDVDQQKFDAWYNESEKHRLYYKRFCVQQEKIMARDCSVVDVERRLMEIKFKRRVKYHSNWWKLCGVAATVLILFSGKTINAFVVGAGISNFPHPVKTSNQ